MEHADPLDPILSIHAFSVSSNRIHRILAGLAIDHPAAKSTKGTPFSPKRVETQRAGCFVMLSQKVTPRAKKPRTENLIRTYLLTNSHPISKVIRAHDRFHPVNRVPSNGQPDEDQTTRGHAISSSRTPPGRRCKS